MQSPLNTHSITNRIQTAHERGRLITNRTARDIATSVTAAVIPGLARFITSGEVTQELYAELVRLRELAQPETNVWLDALTAFCLNQDLAEPAAATVGTA